MNDEPLLGLFDKAWANAGCLQPYDKNLWIDLHVALLAELEKKKKQQNAIEGLVAFISVMFGAGPDCIIPETVICPLGLPIKLGEIMREVREITKPV